MWFPIDWLGFGLSIIMDWIGYPGSIDLNISNELKVLLTCSKD